MKVSGSFCIAATCTAWLLTALGTLAQIGSVGRAAPAADVQLRSYLAQAAEAMPKGDLASAAQKLRSALAIDPHSLAALSVCDGD